MNPSPLAWNPELFRDLTEGKTIRQFMCLMRAYGHNTAIATWEGRLHKWGTGKLQQDFADPDELLLDGARWHPLDLSEHPFGFLFKTGPGSRWRTLIKRIVDKADSEEDDIEAKTPTRVRRNMESFSLILDFLSLEITAAFNWSTRDGQTLQKDYLLDYSERGSDGLVRNYCMLTMHLIYAHEVVPLPYYSLAVLDALLEANENLTKSYIETHTRYHPDRQEDDEESPGDEENSIMGWLQMMLYKTTNDIEEPKISAGSYLHDSLDIRPCME